MSKHVKTIVAAATELLVWDAATQTTHDEGKTLAAKYANWPLDARQKIDELIVKAFADMAGVEVGTRERAHKLHGNIVATFPKGDKHLMRLTRVRKVLFAAEKGEGHTRSGNAGSGVAKLSFEKLLPSVGSFVKKIAASGEKITAAQKKEIRHAANLLLGLLN